MAKGRTRGTSGQVPAPSTVLRLDHGLARSLDAEAQLRQCVDHLENPEVLAHELIQSFNASLRFLETAGEERETGAGEDDEDQSDVLELEHFYEGREVEVEVESESPQLFECVAGSLQPLARGKTDGDDFDGIDYVGVLQLRDGRAVLGTIESKRDATPYLLLLRSLCGLSEMRAALCAGRLPPDLARTLAEDTRFDLHLVVGDPIDRQSPLLQLTRDLAESVKRSIEQSEDHPLTLGDIVCLRMDLAGFEGRLGFEWGV